MTSVSEPRSFLDRNRQSLSRAIFALVMAVSCGTANAQRPLGIDVSEYQSTINWASVAGSGIAFAWAKATEGAGYDDGRFTNNVVNAKTSGIPIGAYHYAHSELNTPGTEAAHFWSVAGAYIQGDGTSMMPMLDMEGTALSGHVGATSVSDWVNQWCIAVSNYAAAVGLRIKPAIYVSACNAVYLNNSVAQWIPWIANWSGDPQTGTPWNVCSNYNRWGTWAVWQYASTGSIPGISGNVDHDVFNGTGTQLTNTLVIASLANNHYTLSPAWAAPAGDVNFPYVTSDGGQNTPNERSFAYNALSNQLIVVRCPPSSTAYAVYVVDAATGASLYTLKTNGVIHEGASEVSGSNPIDLVAAAVADDGAIYICNMSPNASGGSAGNPIKMFHVYRWANSGPNTAPVLVYQGDPSDRPAGVNERWGDVMAARGAGTNTELILNTHDGAYGAVLKPKDSSLTAFTNYWFYDAAGAGSIGRSIQFVTNNTVFEKRKGTNLFLSSYNVTNQTSAPLLGLEFSTTLGGVAVDAARNLAVGVDFVGRTSAPLKPDAVALYDISNPNMPLLIARYDFPSNKVANANFICQTIIAGNRVYSLDGNNGLMSFDITPPVGMVLTMTRTAPRNVKLSWGNPLAILQSSPTLNPPSWTNLAGPWVTESVQSANGTRVFYRLILRL